MIQKRKSSLNDLHRYFESCFVLGKRDPILENHETRILALLLWAIAGKSVCIRGESGSAKTKILNAVTALIYGDEGLAGRNPSVLWLNSSSAKGHLTEDSAHIITQSKRCVIPELQNILTSQNLEAMIKLWMEDRPYIYSKNEMGRRTVRIILDPKPILTNLADGNESLPQLPVEMRRRVISLPTFSSKELNEKVHHLKAVSRMLPDDKLVKLSRIETSGLKNQIKEAMEINKRVINPGADVIRTTIPAIYTMSNTFIDYYFDVIEAVTKFHHRERAQDLDYIYSTPADNFIGFLLAGSIFRDMSIGINPIGKEIIDFVPKAEVWGDLVTESESDAVHIDEITDHLSTKGINRTKKMIEYTMERLVDTNFVRRLNKTNKYYRTQDFDFSRSVDWKGLVDACITNMESNSPHIAEEYKKDDLHMYTDPFTGEHKNIPMTLQVYGGHIDEGV